MRLSFPRVSIGNPLLVDHLSGGDPRLHSSGMTFFIRAAFLGKLKAAREQQIKKIK